jgi:DNA repair exonuclease SbcCD ATPase subunit
MDFIVDDIEYRIARTRTKKGSSDLSLLERNNVIGNDNDVYHKLAHHKYEPFTDKKDVNKYWKDISGRRAADTEKELAKLIKLNLKSFRSTIHFMQNDFSGLTTATPEKRKGILKEALNLIIFSKLEKISKDRFNLISKDVDKYKLLIDALGSPEIDLISLQEKDSLFNNNAVEISFSLKALNIELNTLNNALNVMINSHSNLKSKFSSLIDREKIISSEKIKAENSIKEYSAKKTSIISFSKELTAELNALKLDQTKLSEIDYSQIDFLNKDLDNKKQNVAKYNAIINSELLKYDELKIPVPDDSVCKHCRTSLTKDHKIICQNKIASDMKECQLNIQMAKKEINALNPQILSIQKNINNLILSKNNIENNKFQISSKDKEIQTSKALYEEYFIFLKNFDLDLIKINNELSDIVKQLSESSIDEANIIKLQIENNKKDILELNVKISSANKDFANCNNSIAVIQHTISQKINDVIKIKELKKSLLDSENKATIYPSVLQAFSSSGIPNLIIQNILDDLQIEANKLLTQLKPGLQLAFFVEKTKGDGTETDTLDIIYQINGKERYYEQLSGAMKLAVTFSLKLGLSFLLQKMIGANVRFLLLDEIDQSLDKASIDAFSDIIKFFQKEYKILIITHNDRMKDKFSSAILVEQDRDMISNARVVNSW